jgi:thioredoxin-like negative regulator of GroEL
MTSSSFSTDSLHVQIWRVIELLDDLPAVPASGYRLDELAGSFEALRAQAPEKRTTAEEQIWSAWCDHPEARAKAAIADGIRQLSAGDLERAEVIFDDLVADYPVWAEARNKRATLYFLQNRDAMSVIDIHRTLGLEPRHFGALAGFAQICVRNGAPDAARRALLRLLAINPGAPGIAEAAAALADDAPHVLH